MLSLGLSELAPFSQNVDLGGLPPSRSKFRYFFGQGSRVRIDDLDAPCREFLARFPTSVLPRGPNRTLTSSMQAAGDPVASVSRLLQHHWIPPASVRKTFPPRPLNPLFGSCQRRSEAHFRRPPPASGTKCGCRVLGDSCLRRRY